MRKYTYRNKNTGEQFTSDVPLDLTDDAKACYELVTEVRGGIPRGMEKGARVSARKRDA